MEFTRALSIAGVDSEEVLNACIMCLVISAQSYEQLVASVGTKTHSASINRAAQEARENVSGVNLDEEAANLIRFQNAYQAAAQAVSISRSIFDTLVGAVR